MTRSEQATIVWEGFGLGNPYSGVGRHAACLSSHLIPLGIRPLVIRPQNRQPVYSSYVIRRTSVGVWSRAKLVRSLQIESDKNWCLKVLPPPEKLLIHGLSNFNAPIGGKGSPRLRSVVTIHDLIPFLSPAGVSKSLKWQMRVLLPRVVERVDRIIAVSEWTRRVLTDLYPRAADKIAVIPNGFPSWQGPSELKEAPLTSPMRLLAVGRWEAYKRFDRLINIVKKAEGRIKVQLLTDQRGIDWVTAHGATLVQQGRLELFSQVDDQQLDRLYDISSALIHTSEFEGFCLPAAEALARGLPVIYQKGSGIDEVVGRCGYGLSAQEPIEAWLNAIESFEWRPSLAELQSWVESQCSWSDVAVATRGVYNEVW